jgi:hypothetical protein
LTAILDVVNTVERDLEQPLSSEADVRETVARLKVT